MLNRKRRILLVLYYYDPYVSGVTLCAKRVAEGLAARGHSVTVLASQHEPRLPLETTINKVKVVRKPVMFRLGKGVVMPFFWLSIVCYARRNDIVNIHMPLAESGLSSLFIPKRKMIATYQCDINLGNGLIERIIATMSMLLMKLQLRRTRYVIPSSVDYLEHSKMAAFSWKANPIEPMVTVKEFTPVSYGKLFQRIGIKDRDTVIGFMGRVVYEKGIEYLIEAIPYLQKELTSVKIVIAGDYKNVAGGSVKEVLDGYMQKYPGTVIFTGFLSDAERNQFYSGIDVLVLPSIDPLEAYGMVQVEAMLCGTPVVASDMPGVRQIILKTGYGRLARQRDSEDIARQVTAVVKNMDKYMPQRGRVVRLFDPEKGLKVYEELMQ